MSAQIQSGDYTAVIVKKGAGLASLKYRGRDLVVSHLVDEDPIGFSGKTLIPWPNRIAGGVYEFGGIKYEVPVNEPETGSALHGLKCWDVWDIVEQSDEAITLETRVEPTKGYPFDLVSRATYSLDTTGGLTLKIETTNVGETKAPYGVSTHPYLTCDGASVDECTLTVPAKTVLEVDSNLIPTGEIQVEGTRFDLRNGTDMNGLALDHAFGTLPSGTWNATLFHPGSKTGVTMSANEKWVQVYSGENMNRIGLAIEPMTCPPDAFNTGRDVVVLEPGDTHTFELAILDASER